MVCLVAGLVIALLAPTHPMILRGFVLGAGYLLIGISLYDIVRKLDAMREHISETEEKHDA